MNVEDQQDLKDHQADADRPVAPLTGSALQFKIGDRFYWISRSRDGNAWKIVANGDLVEQASTMHYGDVAAFVKIATRLQEIENQWATIKS